MTLTGLIPAATAYGEALGLEGGSADGQAVTTGHALTTAVIVANLADLLRRCRRPLARERMAIVGLGSVGRSVLELALRVLPHPRRLVLCDLYAKRDTLEALQRRVVRELGFAGGIELAAGDDGLPPAVLDSHLIVAAVDRAGVIDPLGLRAGTILLDDSYPPTFAAEAAWRRMEERRDVIVASGGFARLSRPVEETLYVPSSARPFIDAYGEDRFLEHFRRESRDYTACVFAGPLALRDPALMPALGIPTGGALEAFYAALERHAIGAALPHCVGRPIAEALFAELGGGGHG
jgi:hypothetical protein